MTTLGQSMYHILYGRSLLSTSNLAGEQIKTVNGKAYTQDGILIYNIRVDNLLKDTTDENIKGYFEQFGKVLQVRFVKSKYRESCRVYYANPEDAARAIRKKQLFFMGYTIQVKPCDGWNQPDGLLLIKQLDEYANNCDDFNETNQDALIFNLNADCLIQICKKLSVMEQINFASTCARFYHIFKMFSKFRYRRFNTQILQGFTSFKIKIFFQIVGPQIKILEIHKFLSYYQDLHESIIFCKNVKTLKMTGISLSTEWKHLILEEFKFLEDLTLVSCGVNDGFIKQLQTKDVKCIKIISDYSLTGETLHHIENVEQISTRQCSNIKSSTFKNICENLKHLHYLDIIGCRQLNLKDYKCIVENLVQLETLKLSYIKENFNCIAELPKLRQLEINHINSHFANMKEFLKNLSKVKAHQLEELKLNGSFDMDLEIALSITNLKQLRVLHCQCYHIKNKFLAMFTRLTELEEIELRFDISVTDTAILLLLKDCFQLIYLNLHYKFTSDLLNEAVKLLQNQRACNIRRERVHLNGLLENCDVSKFIQFSNVVKISDFDNAESYIKPVLHFPR